MIRLILLPLLLIFAGCASPGKQTAALQPVKFAERPKNIILLIGDGMALSQVSAGIYWIGVGKTAFERFPVVGFHKSHSCDDLVTDSAAGATAFSCGQKTINNAIGVLPDNKPCTTILEDLDQRGYATGMVVTCSAPHATPASFIAHREIRAFTEEIALDYLKTPIDCFIGGGEHFFNDRPDRLNLEDTLKQRGYVIRRGTTFGRLPLDGSAPFMLFTAEREPPTASANRRYLPDATRTACHYLKKRSDKGFFLMVEGSQIDWACHANDATWLRAELVDFDRTIKQALDFAASDGETLVLVTGDHECGGLALAEGSTKQEFKPVFSCKLHTAAMVPVFAFGPKAELFTGLYDNTEIYGKMRAALEIIQTQ
ncbi:MAG: alkaline phosphatase [Haliscomenobacteraceae bacterium CHB4]|nr:Alkaline phosphatase 3 [Saprospiraceae bacterium]MCE7923421.1 alkaline phosphatase [Haliscomenobacteraceae bacterium CHB4]